MATEDAGDAFDAARMRRTRGLRVAGGKGEVLMRKDSERARYGASNHNENT